MCLQFVKNDNNGISQTEVTYGESTYYKKVTELDLHEIQQYYGREPWISIQNWKTNWTSMQLNSEKLSDLKGLQSLQFYKNYYIGLN